MGYQRPITTQPGVQSITSASTITPNCDVDDLVDITALAVAPTIANPIGTPINGQILRIRVKDNGTARAIAWGSAYVEGTGVALLAATVVNKISNLEFQFNTANSLNKWQQISVVTESAASAGGLSNFTESTGTYSSQTYVALVPNNAASNVNAVFSQKGTGYLSANIPDGTATGGNQRGTNAVDLQTSRSAADKVASGTRAGLFAGQSNLASGTNSVCVGGSYDTVSATRAANIGGYLNSVTAQDAICLAGQRNTIDGSFACGHGIWSTSRGMQSVLSHACGRFGTLGDAQFRRFVLRAESTSATPVVLTLNGSSAGSSNQIILPNNSCFRIRGETACLRTDVAGNRATYSWTASVYRGSSAASTVLDASNVDVVHESDATFNFTLAADTTEGGLTISFVGASGKTVRAVTTAWCCEVTA